MKVVVFGSTGHTGQLLTRTLLDAGHHVVAISRRPGEYPLSASRLEVSAVDVGSTTSVQRVIDGADAVVSVLGVGFTRGPVDLYSRSAAAITGAMARTGTGRLIVTSSAAISPWRDPDANWLLRQLVHHVVERLGRTVYADMRRMERIVAATALQWTIMRPLMLTNAEPPTDYEIAEDHVAGRHTARRHLAAAINDQLSRTDTIARRMAVATPGAPSSFLASLWREGIRPRPPADGAAPTSPA